MTDLTPRPELDAQSNSTTHRNPKGQTVTPWDTELDLHTRDRAYNAHLRSTGFPELFEQTPPPASNRSSTLSNRPSTRPSTLSHRSSNRPSTDLPPVLSPVLSPRPRPILESHQGNLDRGALGSLDDR